MGRKFAFGIACVLISTVFGQQGGGGFGGAGGQQGGRQEEYDGSVGVIQRAINSYLTGNEIQNVLTPGEYSEWPLTLKEGEVIIAEARSEAFDPALQIVDAKATVLAFNDDRYPGDQRPLLLWRCPKAGSYSIRARCFHDKSGGQFFLRSKIFASAEIGAEKTVEREFLVRVPLKAGQIKQVYFDYGDRGQFAHASLGITISPIGLPEGDRTRPLDNVVRDTIMAPVDGDYYFVARAYTKSTVRPMAKELTPTKLTKDGAKAPTNAPVVWSLAVKKGEILEVTTPDLRPSSLIVVAVQPDIAKFDLTKPETNPFFPHPKDLESGAETSAFVDLPARARDGRRAVFLVRRDATLWVATNGLSAKKGEFAVAVKPAAKDFAEAGDQTGRLTIGNTDYWAFDAKAGDVMTLKSTATGFAQQVIVRDPDLETSFGSEVQPDQTTVGWSMIVNKPGRYLVAISSIGDGGGGDYTLARTAFHAKDFGKGAPAQGEIAEGQVQVWKFSAKPGEPLLVHWKSLGWNYSIRVSDEKGNEQGFPHSEIDKENHFGILKVTEQKTFLIVLIGSGPKSTYSIQLNDLPGYVKK